ncbi:MAG: TetR/AcrR family transcriptional regulator [Limisphaerales bacterium]
MRATKTKTEVRREQIADAALKLMAQQGPKSLNLVALARRVGVVPSAIYRHYPGKDAVLDAVLDVIVERFQENVDAARQEAPDAPERLHHLLDRHLQLLRTNMAIPRIVLSEEVFNRNRARRQRVHGIIQGYLAEVAKIVREGQHDGDIRADVSADKTSVMFLGLIHPAVILWLTSDGTFDVGGHANHAWLMFSKMLMTRHIPQNGSHQPSPRKSAQK